MKHSQRLSDTSLSPWFIAEQQGKILSAHCDCMAGLGESCSHVGALLFYVDATVRIRGSKTVTQEKAYWLLPTVHREVEYKEIADIDSTAPKTMKRKLDCRVDNSMNSTADSPKPQTKSCFEKYSTPSDQDLSNLFDALSKCSSKPAIL